MSASNPQSDRDLESLRAGYRDADDLLDERPSSALREGLLREAALVARRRSRPARRWPAALAASVITCTFAALIATHRPPAPQEPVPAAAGVSIAPDTTALVAPAPLVPPPAATAELAAEQPRALARTDARSNPAARERRDTMAYAAPASPARKAENAGAADAVADRATEPAAGAFAAAPPPASPPAPARFAPDPAPALAAPPVTAQRSVMPMSPPGDRATADAAQAVGATRRNEAARAAAPEASARPAWESDPKTWLQHIAELRRQDRNQEADREMRRLRERFPEAVRDLP